jgi:mono/diheme cytochrome c family protein
MMSRTSISLSASKLCAVAAPSLCKHALPESRNSPPRPRRCFSVLGIAAFLLVLSGTSAAGGTTSAADPGSRLYAARCAYCHGPTARGDGRDADLFVTRPRDLRSGFLARYSTAELVDRIREGVRLNLAVDAAAARARAADTEELVRYLERLPAIDWRLAERGEELYVDRCEICHGAFGRAAGALPSGVAPRRDLAAPEFQRSVRDAELAALIRDGHGAMPGLVPRIAARDVGAVIAFVRLLSPGYSLYERYCAACHGDDGRGSEASFADGLRAPTVVFDRDYFARHDAEHVRATAWHMLDEQWPRMPHLRTTLGAADARAIVAYLKRVDAHAP